MNILFYSPLLGRSRDSESIMEGFVKAGHKVFLLTQVYSPEYHHACEQVGVKCFFTSRSGIDGVLKKVYQVYYLTRFCVQYQIDIVYAQLEPANLIAVISAFFVRSKVVTVRHHVDEVKASSTRTAYWVSILIYKISKCTVVVSRRAKENMIANEGIGAESIHFIPLGYNFTAWPAIDDDFVLSKRRELASDFTLITVSRLIKEKRVDLSIQLLAMLKKKNINCRLIVLGKGEESENLKQLATQLEIEEDVYFEGYVNNVLDYISSSDILVHFSLVDSSPTIIKEAGLRSKPVIVCKEVGDCDDYIEDGVSGFLVDRECPLSEAFDVALRFSKDKHHFCDVGRSLREVVLRRFSVDAVLPLYQKLHEKI